MLFDKYSFLQVLGHMKTIAVLTLGWLVFDSILTFKNMLGMALAVIGMVIYSWAVEVAKQLAAKAASLPQIRDLSEEDISLLKSGLEQERIKLDIELTVEGSKWRIITDSGAKVLNSYASPHRWELFKWWRSFLILYAAYYRTVSLTFALFCARMHLIRPCYVTPRSYHWNWNWRKIFEGYGPIYSTRVQCEESSLSINRQPCNLYQMEYAWSSNFWCNFRYEMALCGHLFATGWRLNFGSPLSSQSHCSPHRPCLLTGSVQSGSLSND